MEPVLNRQEMDELKELQAKEFNLSSRAIAEKHLPTKQKIIQERMKVSKQIQILQTKKDKVNTERAINNSKTHIRKNPIILESDNIRIPFDKESLTVTLRFSPCGHTETIALDALIPFQKDYHWQSVKNGSIFSGRMNCKKCFEERRSFLAKFRRYNNKEVGHFNWQIRCLC